ncbi:MAG: excinuclease ABC subunit UvrA [Prevotellaceae bacterium]|jgi:excinuclease ABC subunit A|nr:excinuclease ABC subunit UvrA [Prevotellaceae bacterium]
MTEIIVQGAREHNLKNIDVTIPHNRLTVITGLSGSGKSSLAFNTIYAEGQRRYLETLPFYARQFMSSMERPDVDGITGLSPVIAIEQKTTNKNPRSTVGTITEIYDFLRLLYARASVAYSKNTGEEMVRYTDEQILQLILEQFHNQKCMLLAPLVKGRKGHYKELFEQLRKHGFLTARIDGEVTEIYPQHKLDRYKIHFIEVVVDKLVPGKEDETRLRNSIAIAMRQGAGEVAVLDVEKKQMRYYSRSYMCPTTGISYAEPAPHSFSFNSPQGACPHCNGLGTIAEMDMTKIIPNPAVSIKKGGIGVLGKQRSNQTFSLLEAIARKYQFTLDTPIADIPEAAMNVILHGSDELFRVAAQGGIKATDKQAWEYMANFPGVISLFEKMGDEDNDNAGGIRFDRFIKYVPCPECHGLRLKEEALFFKVAGKNIAELAGMDIATLSNWFDEITPALSGRQLAIAKDILKEIRGRLAFMEDVGLGYLSLSRSTRSLSGGESQRIRLATQIGSKLVNVLYILDEPSIGLHQYDNQKLIAALKKLRDEGNSVIVVEHDEEMIRQSDFLIDLGPAAGVRGGQVIYAAPPPQERQEGMDGGSLTLQYLSGKRQIPVPEKRRKGNGKKITLSGASGNNLKNITVDFPLGVFICVTGMSGSGKSTLINNTLHPLLSRKLYRSFLDPLPYESVEGIAHIDKVIEVNQAPIGRTPRSNPVTYTGLFADIRRLFEETPDAKIRGYKSGRFSFNVKGGRCEECRGAGVQTIEMNFLPNVYVTCKTCNGKRYNRETLEVLYKGKNISDVLNMTVDAASDFFTHIPPMRSKLQALQQVGLGYVKLGQPSTTLSGGESQRVKLAAELARQDTGNTLYILDEPTTGLHFEDVRILLDVLNRLVDHGNTVLVIEHHLDVIKTADHIIDLGPDGGAKGGYVVAAGTPEEIAQCPESYTGQFLRDKLS